jgi:hypothetical protein
VGQVVRKSICGPQAPPQLTLQIIFEATPAQLLVRIFDSILGISIIYLPSLQAALSVA